MMMMMLKRTEPLRCSEHMSDGWANGIDRSAPYQLEAGHTKTFVPSTPYSSGRTLLLVVLATDGQDGP